jgi:hypothetical protein
MSQHDVRLAASGFLLEKRRWRGERQETKRNKRQGIQRFGQGWLCVYHILGMRAFLSAG